MTLSVVPADPSLLPFIEAVAIRLADEGIPIRAIARVTRIAPGDVYNTLRDAIGRGVICEMPKDDWPTGSNRASRMPFTNPVLDEIEAFKFAAARCFRVTPLEATVFAVLLKRRECTKEQLHNAIEQGRAGEHKDQTEKKIIDVVICKLRKKLTPHNILIETVWSQGYLIAPEHRARAIAMMDAYATGNEPALREALDTIAAENEILEEYKESACG